MIKTLNNTESDKAIKRKTVSFLVSGNGSNFQAVAEKIIRGDINADTGILISNKQDAFALKRAEKLGVKSIFIDPAVFSSKTDYEKEMINCFNAHNTDLIVAAGYMRILSPFFINYYTNRIINIHPSLLPSFRGKDAQQQALDCGVRIAGCTTHFIDSGVDTGPIILQAAVKVYTDDNADTLSSRIILEEHKILSESVRLFCEDRLDIKEKKVIILD